MSRRTSGEVINATLMEVFVVLAFVVLQQLQEARSGARSEMGRCNQELERCRAELKRTAAALAECQEECTDGEPPCLAEGVALAEVDIRESGEMATRMLQSFGPYRRGDAWVLPAGEFARRFDALRQHSEANKRCFFVAYMSREPGMTLESYERLYGIVASRFNVHLRKRGPP
jgi:hypothetical protein